jgi:ABC-type Na+ efflux pump permease subunit
MTGLSENPLILREQRVWRRRMRDWRLWLGLRVPRGAREWGLPAVVWFALAPYVIWASVVLLRRVAPGLPAADNVVIFEIVVFALMLYACLVIAVSTAAAVAGERQQATWESILATPLSGAELVVGNLLARAGPTLGGVLLAILVWAVARPHYATLLEPVGGIDIPAADFPVFGGAMLLRMLTIGAAGIAVSSRSCRLGSASAGAIALALMLLAVDLGTKRWLDGLGAPALNALLFLIGSLLFGCAALEAARRWIRWV